jgi:superfamily I DNA/RNA helicase
LSSLFDGLNPAQRKVALCPGHCLTIACPGSGKTNTLARKAAQQLADGLRVCAVTFTREAAYELRERISSLAPPNSQSRLLVGTFHSICNIMAAPKSFRGEFGRAIVADQRSPFQQPFQVVKEGIRISYVIRAIRESGLKMSVKDATALIERLKGTPDTNPDIQEKAILDVYTQLLDQAAVVDYQDIILKTNAALANGQMSPLALDHLAIDEYQDTDESQYVWAAHHGRAGIALTVVGDDDQSIYAFRRALGYGAMERFSTQFAAEKIFLDTNYRCKAEILDAAAKVISKNRQRIDKELNAIRGAGGIVTFEYFDTDASQYAAVAEEAALTLAEGQSFAAIARTNDELSQLQGSFHLRGIPFVKSDGKSIFDCAEVQAYAAVLRLIVKPTSNDIDVVLSWAGMSAEDSTRIRGFLGASILVCTKEDLRAAGVTGPGIEIWRAFAKKYATWSVLHQQGLNRSLGFGIHEWLSETLQKPNSLAILAVARDIFAFDEVGIAQRLAAVKKLEDRQKLVDKGQTDESAAAYLMTAHGSKGLEFDRVWITGLNHDNFPSKQSPLEEERRLMFVAMTRAKDVLYLSALRTAKPSGFVLEAEIKIR